MFRTLYKHLSTTASPVVKNPEVVQELLAKSAARHEEGLTLLGNATETLDAGGRPTRRQMEDLTTTFRSAHKFRQTAQRVLSETACEVAEEPAANTPGL